MMAGKLFIISAPSGTGKTSLVNTLLRDWKNNERQLKKVVTYTTRPSRKDEVEGRDYHFISREDFEKKQEEGFFLESGLFCGNYYGSPANVLNPAYRNEDSYLLVIDRAGGLKIKDTPGAVLIWITPPSLQELRTRLEKRGKDSIESIEQRIKKAQEELECEEREKSYAYHLINDDFVRAENELKSLVGAVIAGVEKDTNKEVSINFLRKSRPAR
jgi:guanylate kinase